MSVHARTPAQRSTREAGQVYTAWRKGSRVVRERILTEPELFTTFTANGKGADHYEAWLADILCRSTLA